MLKGGSVTRADWVHTDSLKHILAALMPANRLAIETSLATGLRIDDVLHLRTADLSRERFTIKERKTGKARRLRLPQSLRDDLLGQAGRWWVFEGRTDPRKPRTRQAVWKDLHRACVLFRISKQLHISPHSARKIYAVSKYQTGQSLDKVRRLLNHSNEAVTMIYAMADEMTARRTRAVKTNLPQ